VVKLLKEELWNIDEQKIDIKKLEDEKFIEAFKMFIDTNINKKQLWKILYKYLIWEFEKLEKSNQYNTKNNIEWIKNNLSKEQTKIWLWKNEKKYDIENNNEDNLNENNIQIKLDDHLEISIKKIIEFNKKYKKDFDINFNKTSNLVNYFYKIINKEREELCKIDENLFFDLELQIKSINNLFISRKSKKIEYISISRELNPLDSLMMWNWVEWSCLSFYSSVKNYYSAISNTIDINKGVYYIKDHNDNILARVLLAIDENNKIMRFKMYFSWNTNIDLNFYFNKYYLDLANNIWLTKNWNQTNLKLLESEKWYPDGTVDL